LGVEVPQELESGRTSATFEALEQTRRAEVHLGFFWGRYGRPRSRSLLTPSRVVVGVIVVVTFSSRVDYWAGTREQ